MARGGDEAGGKPTLPKEGRRSKRAVIANMSDEPQQPNDPLLAHASQQLAADAIATAGKSSSQIVQDMIAAHTGATRARTEAPAPKSRTWIWTVVVLWVIAMSVFAAQFWMR